MIPKIIHYCWFGKGVMPELVERCIASWHTYMPDWEYRLWSESSLSQTLTPQAGGEDCWLEHMPRYVQEAYAANKYAFVSNYVRLWALEREGGVYLDTDVEMLRPFDSLLNDTSFIGLEESLALLPGTCVMGCEAHYQWVKDLLRHIRQCSIRSRRRITRHDHQCAAIRRTNGTWWTSA